MTGTSEELKQAWIKAWVAYGFGDYEVASRRFEAWLKRFKAESKQLSACWSARTMANCRQLMEEIHRHIGGDGGRYGRPTDQQQRMNSAFWAGRHIMVLLSRQDRTMEGAVPIVKATPPAPARPAQAAAKPAPAAAKPAPAAAKPAPAAAKPAPAAVKPAPAAARPAVAALESAPEDIPVSQSVPSPETESAVVPAAPSEAPAESPEVEVEAGARTEEADDLSLEDVDLSDLDVTDLDLGDMDLGELDLDDESLEGLDNLELDDLEGLDLDGLDNMELDDLEGIE